MIDGSLKGVASYGTGAVIALLAIAMVFTVLLLIIILTDVITKVAGKEEVVTGTVEEPHVSNNSGESLNINDEDATVACLVASIDMRKETNKNIQILNVREVK